MNSSAKTSCSPFSWESGLLLAVAGLFAIVTFAVSWWHWWTFQYPSFDIAFYVQSLWLAMRGEWQGSLLGVSLMGNHAEPITFLILPLFAVLPHPMLLVAVQTVALATMPFTGWQIGTALGIARRARMLLALVTLAAPATGFIGHHEFHPEALAAPLLLLLIKARVLGDLRQFWIWFVLTVAVKENVALLLVGWGLVHAWLDRSRGVAWQVRWNIVPAALAASWVLLYALWLNPWLNAGRVDYGQLYAHLGGSTTESIGKAFTDPGRFFSAAWRGASGGNLVWGMLLTFAALPLLRLRWLLIATPILLQHLLSSRASEWTMHFHYAAPILPLLWIATAEVVAARSRQVLWAAAPFAACLVLQLMMGPYRAVPAQIAAAEQTLWHREQRAKVVAALTSEPETSVVAGMPYLSHLTTRRELHSLHFVLKGLRTLSHSRYQPPEEVDAVLLDYSDDSTFNQSAGFYHPAAASVAGKPLPSSDELLNVFLQRHLWSVKTINSLTLLQRGKAADAPVTQSDAVMVNASSALRGLLLGGPEEPGTLRLELDWTFTEPRTRIPWILLLLNGDRGAYPIMLGMAAPEAGAGPWQEIRLVRVPPSVPAGRYEVQVLFIDQIETLWAPKNTGRNLGSIPAGTIHLGGNASSER